MDGSLDLAPGLAVQVPKFQDHALRGFLRQQVDDVHDLQNYALRLFTLLFDAAFDFRNIRRLMAPKIAAKPTQALCEDRLPLFAL